VAAGVRGRAGLSVVIGVLAAAIALAALASLALGSQSLAPGAVWQVLTGGGSEADRAVVEGLRVPRTLLGLVCGAALGVAGALTQAHTRNPLADPGLIGVNAGASLGVVVAISYLGLVSPAAYAWFAVLGAVVAGAVVIGLAARITMLEPMTTVVLVGAVLSALLASATSAVVLLEVDSARSFTSWSVGSLAGRDLSVAAGIAPVLALGVVAALLALPALPGLELGDELAAALGRNPARDRVIGLGAVVLLAGGATAACGTLGFLGLLAPHLARRLCGARPIATVGVSALCGALIILLADVVGRVVLVTSEVSVGVMLAIVGAPVFVVLARQFDRGTVGGVGA